MMRKAPPIAVIHALLVLVIVVWLPAYVWGMAVMVSRSPWPPPYDVLRAIAMALVPLVMVGFVFHRATRWAIARGATIRRGLPAHFRRAWVLYLALLLSALQLRNSGQYDVVFPVELVAGMFFVLLLSALGGVMLAEHQAIRDAAP